jgi:nucleoside-diphosphate kinase
MERTFVMLKPGVLQRRITGELIGRFERKGLRIIAIKLVRLDRHTVETHYAEHKGKDFYEKLVSYTLSGPVIAMVLEGEDAIGAVRRLTGPTSTADAQPGTIRGDFAACTRLNIVHASDSAASAKRETALFSGIPISANGPTVTGTGFSIRPWDRRPGNNAGHGAPAVPDPRTGGATGFTASCPPPRGDNALLLRTMNRKDSADGRGSVHRVPEGGLFPSSIFGEVCFAEPPLSHPVT